MQHEHQKLLSKTLNYTDPTLLNGSVSVYHGYIWGGFESNVNPIWWSFSTILSNYHGTIWHDHCTTATVLFL